MLDNNRADNNISLVGGSIKIKGSDLYVALKNFGRGKQSLGKNIGIQ